MLPTPRPHALPLARIGLVAALALGLAACQGEGGAKDDPAPRAEARGGTFHMAQVIPQVIDPARIGDSYEAALINQLFDGLLEFDHNFSTLPGVAQSWQISRDGTEYSFELARGVRFHDGSEVVAEDVIYSLERVFRLPAGETGLAREYLTRIEGSEDFAAGRSEHMRGLEALGPHELRITLARPYASFLAVLASEFTRIVPRHYVEEVGDAEFARRPVGCGPFRLEEWVPGERIVLAAFDDYHRGRAHLDRLLYEQPRGSARDYAIDRFERGELTAVELTPGMAERFRGREGVRVHSRQELSLSFLAFDVRKPPFDDARVRQAFCLALDLDRVGPRANARSRPNGILPPGMPGYTPDPKLPAYDPDAARRLLAEAGYERGVGLPPLAFGSPERSEEEKATHREIARQVALVGFELQPSYFGWAEFDNLLSEGAFNSFSLAWIADVPDPDSFLYPLFHSRGSNNYGGYANPEVDRLLEGGRSGGAAQGRLEIYRAAERLVLQDMAVLPLQHTMARIAVRDDVRGFSVTSMGMGNLPLHDVWLERGAEGASVALDGGRD